MSIAPRNSEDQSLLRAWAERADEAAFCALVQRHLGMVQATALRKVERGSLAEEVGQTVFALLARRAGKLASHPCLAGWLHRAAVLEASNVLRRERKHHHVMDKLAGESTHAGGNPLERVFPHLDAAIESLSESDRHAIFLRFTERLSFDDMGARLGKSADACQKQTSRAVDRLSVFLRRRGCVLSAASAGAAVTAGTAKTASASAVAATSGAALKATANLPLFTLIQHSLHAMNTTKQITAAAAVVAAVASLPLASQWSEAAALLNETSVSASAPAKSPAVAERVLRAAEVRKPDLHAVSAEEAEEILSLLAGLEARAVPSHELMLILSRVLSLPASHIQQALDRIGAMKNIVYQVSLHFALFARWSELDPKAALAAVPGFSGTPLSSMLRSLSTTAVAQGWMAADPRGLLEALKARNNELQKIDESLVPSIARLDPGLAEEFLKLYPAHTAPLRRLEYLLATDPDNFVENAKKLIAGIEQPEGAPMNVRREAEQYASRVLSAMDPQRALAEAEKHRNENGVSTALSRLNKRNPAESLTWLNQQSPAVQNRHLYDVQDAIRAMTAEERAAFVAAGSPETTAQRVMVTAHVIAEKHPLEAVAFAEQAPEETRQRTFRVVASGWTESDPKAASEWVDSLPPGQDRDHGIEGLTLRLTATDPGSAMIWAASIGDAAQRETVLRKRIAVWLHDDRSAAETWLKSSDIFTPQQRDEILAAKNLTLER